MLVFVYADMYRLMCPYVYYVYQYAQCVMGACGSVNMSVWMLCVVVDDGCPFHTERICNSRNGHVLRQENSTENAAEYLIKGAQVLQTMVLDPHTRFANHTHTHIHTHITHIHTYALNADRERNNREEQHISQPIQRHTNLLTNPHAHIGSSSCSKKIRLKFPTFPRWPRQHLEVLWYCLCAFRPLLLHAWHVITHEALSISARVREIVSHSCVRTTPTGNCSTRALQVCYCILIRPNI